MTSIITNTSAMNALSALREVNDNMATTQDRISSGLKVGSAKDNAAYFQISETMKGDSSAYASINEGLTLTKNSVATARLGSETIQDLAQQFLDKVAFAQGAAGGQGEIQNDLQELVKQMETTLSQSTFNGDDMLGAGSYSGTFTTEAAVNGGTGALTSSVNSDATVGVDRNVVTGISRAGTGYATTDIVVGTYDMAELVRDFKAISTDFETNATAATGEAFLAGVLASTEGVVGKVSDIATKLGQSEKSIENQQEFLNKLTDNIDSGVGSMIDADMEEEAARLQALQTQQQLATQSLSIANQAPSNVLSLFQ
ncbi:flagellin [Neptunicoccus cionae]|uniref:flagellin n=1 Tax=Neptunicoccus cionae TaxID=2035344 RepID=UPI000C78AF62|nr:flagellin [Amylibacter cionae]MBR9865216.1 flagellar protein [Paracoccaceae bacterium]PLS21167.1 flagellar protein [Amylibacter cionae]